MYSNNSSSARSKPGALTMASATRLTWWVAWWAPWQPRPLGLTGEWLGDIQGACSDIYILYKYKYIHVDDMIYFPSI